jgi:predicted dehydrogenase
MDELVPDGIMIATPHYDHPKIAFAAFERGIHVLVEKPLGVDAYQARQMVAAWEKAKKTHPHLVFAAMFQQHTLGHWRKIKQLITEGDLGRLVRTTWIITDWFRTQSYYNSGGWRATWSGEGGGVLLNQCPHNLDLYCWFVGLPSRVRGFASLGKYHDIEVEDEVTGYFEHANGMVGHFITTTGEAPGTNRLEIVGENGKVVYENNQLTFYRNRVSMLSHLAESPERFAIPENWKIVIPTEPVVEAGHRQVLEDFALAVRDQRDPIVPAATGVDSVLLGNAILYSSLENKTIDLPMDEEAYDKKLQELAATSRFVKKVPTPPKNGGSDFSKSF